MVKLRNYEKDSSVNTLTIQKTQYYVIINIEALKLRRNFFYELSVYLMLRTLEIFFVQQNSTLASKQSKGSIRTIKRSHYVINNRCFVNQLLATSNKYNNKTLRTWENISIITKEYFTSVIWLFPTSHECQLLYNRM